MPGTVTEGIKLERKSLGRITSADIMKTGGFFTSITCSILLRIAVLLACLLLLCGFSFSDPHKVSQEIKQDLRQELQKIAEMTPGAKLRNEWRARRNKAEGALKQAEMVEAKRFCPEKWDEAVAVFKKAKYYASKRSYRKAIFLAKKAEEQAAEARTLAQKILDQKTSELNRQYRKLRLRADDVTASVPPGAEKLAIQAADISLAVEDVRIAIELRQFEDAEKKLPAIRKELQKLEGLIRAYKKAHPPPDDEEDS